MAIASPRVGLLSIGTEEGKGTELTDQTHQLLKGLGNQINYVGLVEGFQLFNNEVDVVVTDGFTGNVILKSCESLWGMLKSILPEEFRKNPIGLMGALLRKGGLVKMKERLNPKRYGGAPLLGLKGTVLKAHGSSNHVAIAHAIRIAGTAIEQNLALHTLSAITTANETLSEVAPVGCDEA